MPATLLAPLCALLYLAATGAQLLHIAQRGPSLGRGVLLIGIVALVLHGVIAWDSTLGTDGVNLGFFKISALMFLVINLASLGSLARRPLQNLLVLLFPLSALSVLVSTFAPDTAALQQDLPGGMLLHIGSSILAYAVLTIAAAQSALLALQDYQLKHHHTRGIVQILPPLQLMETML
ncbi:MAG: cytochrome c biogenesis protein CcsA, partial [Halioglobus sp.]|nr:cytochrome c biogenesis protein CcsA [Halioglobus sp.]